MAKQIRSKEIVASILDEDPNDLAYYNDLLESKNKKLHQENKKQQQQQSQQQSADKTADIEKLMKENEYFKKRNEQIFQELTGLEKENKLLEKGLRELQHEIGTLGSIGHGTSGGTIKGKGKETIIKCPTLDKLLNVILIIKAFILKFIYTQYVYTFLI